MIGGERENKGTEMPSTLPCGLFQLKYSGERLLCHQKEGYWAKEGGKLSANFRLYAGLPEYANDFVVCFELGVMGENLASMSGIESWRDLPPTPSTRYCPWSTDGGGRSGRIARVEGAPCTISM